MSAQVIETVPCPCGNGYATHRRETVSRPNGNVRRHVVHHYRHSGCHIGGHVVTLNGNVVSKGGPLFRAGRDELGRFQSAADTRLIADGGEKS